MSSLGEVDVTQLLESKPVQETVGDGFLSDQRKDLELKKLCDCLELGRLPEDGMEAQKVVAQADGVLYFVDAKRGNRK